MTTKTAKFKPVSDDTLKKRNAAFNALPPMKKRVAVAKDVLLQIKIGKLIPESFTYGEMSCAIESSDNLQLILMEDGVSCNACAKGAAVLAKARLGNEVYGNPGDAADDVSEEIFGGKLAWLLEVLFEDLTCARNPLFTKGETEAFLKYMGTLPDKIDHPEGRMIAIYQNIITNRGRLKIGKFKF